MFKNGVLEFLSNTSDIFKFGEYSLNESFDCESTEYTGGNPPLMMLAPPFKKLSNSLSVELDIDFSLLYRLRSRPVPQFPTAHAKMSLSLFLFSFSSSDES